MIYALIVTGLLATVVTGQTPDVRWTFGDVGNSSYRLDSFSPQSANFGPLRVEDPTLPLEEGKRYEVTVDAEDHPFEVLAKASSPAQDIVLLAMDRNGSFESNAGVNWQEHSRDRASFTLTPALHNAMKQGGRRPGYRCRPHKSRMRGDFTVKELPPPPPPTVPFSLGPVEDIELGNDAKLGPDGNSNGSGTGARDIEARRRVFLISYDISSLQGREDLANVSFNLVSHNIHGETNVYGVIEAMDLLEVESLTWNTAPGVQNDPTPEVAAPVALDMDDLTDVLVSFVGPGEALVRFSTDTSDALADFINSDTDGILTFLFAPAAEGNQLIVRARQQALGGTLLEGVSAPISNILYIVADPTGAEHVTDMVVGDFLTELGHKVTYFDDGESEADTEAAAAAADLVYISESVGSGGIKNEITEIATPMIVAEPWAWDEMGLTANSGGGADVTSTDLEIVDANHFMAAGLSGIVPVITALEGPDGIARFGKGEAGVEATVIAAALIGETTYDVIFVYEKGAALAQAPKDGSPQLAAEMRIGLGFDERSHTLLNENALGFIEAAVNYALGRTGALTATLTGAAAGTDSTATGSAVLQPNADGTAIGYVLSVTTLANARMAHIHVSDEAGGNGGVVVWLYPAGPPPVLVPGAFTGVLGEGEITADSLAGSLAGQSLDALIQAIQENRAYVNVHTEQFGAGEIRGQLE